MEQSRCEGLHGENLAYAKRAKTREESGMGWKQTVSVEVERH